MYSVLKLHYPFFGSSPPNLKVSLMKRLYLAAAIFGGMATGAFAQEADIKKSIETTLPGAKVLSVADTVVKDVFQVELSSGQVVHVTGDGKHLFGGDLFELKSGRLNNITENWRAGSRVDALKSLQDKDLVVFPAQGVEKGQVYVFTDTSCGYCVKFHSEVPELNSKGITVKYAAWPRSGIDSAQGKLMTDVWCAADRRDAMNKAKTRQSVEPGGKSCSDQVVRDQIDLGHKMGVDGTPALFDKQGRKLGGYVPAAALANMLTGN